MGPTLDPHAAFLIQRGMRTYFLRYERQCANALAVSEFLQRHPRVKRVHYPGLEGHPQHRLAAKQMKDFGSVVTVDLDGGYAECGRFAEQLKFFSIAASRNWLINSKDMPIAPLLQNSYCFHIEFGTSFAYAVS